MAGKRSNGEGSISYDKRRKRYRAKVTIGWEYDEEAGKTKQLTKTLGSSYKTKGEASRALAEYFNEPYNLDNKDATFSDVYNIWFDKFIEDHESAKYRIRSAYAYCSRLYNKKFRDITITDMRDILENGTRVSVSGKNKGKLIATTPSVKMEIKYLFNHMYDFAVESRIVNINYARNFTLGKKVYDEYEESREEKVPFSQEDLQKLWACMEFVPFADMIIYDCYSGWRPTELVELKVRDVDIENGYISGGIKTDAGINRVVPIHPLVYDIVKKYYDDAILHNSEYLFNDSSKAKGIGLSYDQYNSRFNNIMELLKFTNKYTPHCARHTFTTKAKKAEINEYIIKRIVGHSIKDITERIYTHREKEELAEAIRKIEK